MRLSKRSASGCLGVDCTSGAPLGVTVAELAIEAFVPVDEPTRGYFGLPVTSVHEGGPS